MLGVTNFGKAHCAPADQPEGRAHPSRRAANAKRSTLLPRASFLFAARREGRALLTFSLSDFRGFLLFILLVLLLFKGARLRAGGGEPIVTQTKRQCGAPRQLSDARLL
jgi:hypothetical protein